MIQTCESASIFVRQLKSMWLFLRKPQTMIKPSLNYIDSLVVSRKFQGRFKASLEISYYLALFAASRADGGLVLVKFSDVL